jgi:hypothetical protein
MCKGRSWACPQGVFTASGAVTPTRKRSPRFVDRNRAGLAAYSRGCGMIIAGAAPQHFRRCITFAPLARRLPQVIPCSKRYRHDW